MKIERVASYKVGDEVFTSKAEAKAYQEVLGLGAAIVEAGFEEPTATEVRDFLLAGGWDLIEKLSDIQRHRNPKPPKAKKDASAVATETPAAAAE